MTVKFFCIAVLNLSTLVFCAGAVDVPTQVAAVEFSQARGFYENGLSLTLSCPTPGSKVYYSLDGSTPSSSSTQYTKALTISQTTCVRAVGLQTNLDPSLVVTHTYLFLDDILTQSANGKRASSQWPSGPVNGQEIDYGMDPEIVNHPEYGPLLKDVLLAVPSLSLVTDLEYLFDGETGIYVNALEYGNDWERPTSLELIYPDGQTGFQINAGLRIRGGYSRGDSCPKHAWRLFFRTEYGQAKLEYPLFGDEGADQFDKIDLRCPQNYSWSFKLRNESLGNTFVRDVFSRDLQGALGQPYTRSRYYHLYLNGQYWGLYQTQERAEAAFGETYFGGNREDYDVVKADAGRLGTKQIEATDGTLDTHAALWALANQFDNDSGSTKDRLYQQMQGNNPDGSPNPDYPKYMDVDNLIDYMLTVYYSGDKDAPISNFFGNVRLNNFFGLINRVEPDGFKFFRHDAEHSLDKGLPDRTGPFTVIDEKNNHLYFNPQTLHQWLIKHESYRLRFADHVHKHCTNGGPMTDDQALALIEKRIQQIDLAIIAESARWGDAQSKIPLTQNDWFNALNSVRNFLDGRTDILLDQLNSKHWLADLDAAVFYINGETQQRGMIENQDQLTMTQNNGSSARIWYCTDGSDPRALDGGIASGAIPYTSSIRLAGSTWIKARVYQSGMWSALHEGFFALGPITDSLRITELMYHPMDESDAEYVELKNIGSETIDLLNVTFTKGISYRFNSLPLAPGAFIILAKDPALFTSTYTTLPAGTPVVGPYDGQLSNGGERLLLNDPIGPVIHNFTYQDDWYPSTDGEGPSLEIRPPMPTDPNAWNQSETWMPSAKSGGSPGR